MRSAFVRTLVELAEHDDRIVLLTGDLGFMALEPFAEAFPDRFYNMGVAEQNMIGVATGLAEAGYRPYCYSIVPFAVLRPFEFIRNGPALHQLPVTIVGMGGGFEYGTAGPSHYGVEDVGVMRLLPDVAIVVPADADQAATATRAMAEWPGPVYLRLGKNDSLRVPGLDGRFDLGRVQEVRSGSDIVIVAMGSVAANAVAAAEELHEDGITTRVVVLSSVTPAPTDDLIELVSEFRRIVTVEAHISAGGIGSLVAEVIADSGADCRLVRIGVEQPFHHPVGGEAYLNHLHGLSSEAIGARVREIMSVEPRR
jgi:transketolase